MNPRILLAAEVAMLAGLIIAVIGGICILIFSERGPVDGLVFWGVLASVLVFTSGRSAIAMLKREVERLRVQK